MGISRPGRLDLGQETECGNGVLLVAPKECIGGITISSRPTVAVVSDPGSQCTLAAVASGMNKVLAEDFADPGYQREELPLPEDTLLPSA